MAAKKKSSGTKKSGNKRTASSLIEQARSNAKKDYDPGPELTAEVKRIIDFNDRVHPVSDRIKLAEVLGMLEDHGHKVTSERFQDWVRRTWTNRSSFTQKK